MAYSRVNWQSGTKQSDAYVEIDGTQHTVTPAVYSGSTPCNPAGLNIMDAGIEENSKLLNGKLTVEEITLDKIELKNKFNKETVVEDSIIDLDGSVVSGKSGWCASDFIPVKANTKYVYQGITNQGSEKYSAYYDSNKQFISYFTQETGFNKRITTPNGACYVRFSMLSSNKEDFQLELGEWSTEYIPYKELIDSDYTKGVKPMGSITVEDIACKNLFDINGEINVADNSDNIVEKNTVSNNILTANSNSWAEHSAGQKFTNLAGKTITVSAKVVSTGTGQYGRIFLIDNGTTIAFQNGITNDIITFTATPTSNNVKVIFTTTGDSQAQSGRGAQFTNIQVEIGEVATDYVGYKEFGSTTPNLIRKMFNIPSERLRSTDNIDNFYNELGVKVYSIWEELPIGMPSGVYAYGTLISITQSTSSMFLNTQIYIPDEIHNATSSSSGNRGLYIRTGTQNWLRITGTTVSKTTN